MKTLIILYMFLFLNLNINLMLIINYFYLNIFSTPLKQLIYLISYSMFMTLNILIYKPSISMNLFILLIIFISGMMILFSYFICMLNNTLKKNNYFKLFYSNLLLFIMFIQTMNMKNMILKNSNFNFSNNNNNKYHMIKKLYLTPNYMMLIMFIIMLILMLMYMTKMCYINNKPLRMKK
nr:TPA: ND6 [Bombus confusus]